MDSNVKSESTPHFKIRHRGCQHLFWKGCVFTMKSLFQEGYIRSIDCNQWRQRTKLTLGGKSLKCAQTSVKQVPTCLIYSTDLYSLQKQGNCHNDRWSTKLFSNGMTRTRAILHWWFCSKFRNTHRGVFNVSLARWFRHTLSLCPQHPSLVEATRLFSFPFRLSLVNPPC